MKSTGIEKQAMDKAVGQIFNHIARLYDSYQDKTANMSEARRKQMGAQIDKRQRQMMDDLQKLQTKMIGVLEDMTKSQALKKAQFKNSQIQFKECLQDIQTINKKKSPLFKVDQNLERLVKSTTSDVEEIRKNLGIAGESKFLCCGTDGAKKFLKILQRFRVSASQWNLLASLEPKDSVQTFVSPKFSDKEFGFIRDILNRFWPEKVVEEKVVERVQYVQTGTGKLSRLVEANEYIYGVNREENPFYGLNIYKQQADKNDSDTAAAATFLGQVYEEGLLLPQDLTLASKYYKKAMSAKHPYAFYRFAMALIKGELRQDGVNKSSLKDGFDLLKQVADGENTCPQAMVELGQFYEKGRFASDKNGLMTTTIDLKRAIDYYQRARARNVPRAANNLGVLYINNKNLLEGNPNSRVSNEDVAHQNMQKGLRFLQQAERFGFPQAYYNLGCIYESGLIENRKNPELALKHYYKGGLKGDIQSRLKFAYQLMNQTSIMKQQYEDHYKKAYRWLQSIISKVDMMEENSPAMAHTPQNLEHKGEAYFYLGLMHEYGFGMEKNAKQAFAYFLQSNQLGYPAAKNKVGDCYFSGYGVRQDRKLALGCYLQACEKNNSDAMVNMGTIYLNGIPGMVERNYNEAYKYFLKALELENTNAMIHLSYMYKNHLGIAETNNEQQREMARKLLQSAAANKNPTALYMLREMDGEYDDEVHINNLDHDLFNIPNRLNLKEVVPYVFGLKN